MPVWLVILCIIALIAVTITLISVFAKHSVNTIISKFKLPKPKIIVYKADKDSKKDELQN